MAGENFIAGLIVMATALVKVAPVASTMVTLPLKMPAFVGVPVKLTMLPLSDGTSPVGRPAEVLIE